jgi:integrase
LGPQTAPKRHHALAVLSDLVFAGAAGGHVDSRVLRAEYKAALARAGLRPLRFHDLRHTFGTRAVEQAESILELKE